MQGAENVRKDEEEECGDHDREAMAHPADDHHDDEWQRPGHQVESSAVDVPHGLAVKRARQPGHGSGYNEREQLVANDVDPEGLGDRLVLLETSEGATDPRP